MRLLVIGHTAHYMKDGVIVGWGPTVKELDWLSRAFDSLTHLACFHAGPPPASALPYDSDRIRFVGVPPAGGRAFSQKTQAFTLGPRYLKAILQQISQADVIQVRTPGILGLYAMLVVSLIARKPHWVKYAGNWVEPGPMPPSFRIQRDWLRLGFSRGPVTINGHWPGQPSHLFSFLNPSLTLEEIAQARKDVSAKRLSGPLRIVFAGRLEAGKGAQAAIEIMKELCLHLPVRLDLLGDGPIRVHCERLISEYHLEDHVFMPGWVSHDTVKSYLRQAHIILHPSESEGWPKILSEGMAYGAVPVASAVSAIPQVLSEFRAGCTAPPRDILAFSNVIQALVDDPQRWLALTQAGMQHAPEFTYERYLLHLDELFTQYYGSSPMDQAVLQSLRIQYQELLG